MRVTSLSFAVISALLLLPREVLAEPNWPQWRGPSLNGTSPASGLPLTWGEADNVKWKIALPSWGGATPIVWGNRVFVVSPSGASDKAAEGTIARRFPRSKRGQPGGPDILLLCFNAVDGAKLWSRPLSGGNALFGKQNMASPSPVTDGRHVWAVTGTGVVSAFDFDGSVRWQRNLQSDYGEFGLYWGYASSPLLYDGKLFIEVLHMKGPSYLIALDAATGKTVWTHNRVTDATRECPDAYTTPTILSHGGRTELIVTGADYVTAHDLATGTEFWRSAGLNPDKKGNYRIVASPVTAGNLVFAPTRVRPLLALRGGGSGDVTTTHLAWKLDKGGPDVPTPICDGRYLYLINDKGIAHCLDIKTGAVLYGPHRTAIGTVSASPVLADGKIYIINENCTTTVYKAGPKFEILATNELDDEYTISTIAPAGKHLFIRSSSHLYCIGQ